MIKASVLCGYQRLQGCWTPNMPVPSYLIWNRSSQISKRINLTSMISFRRVSKRKPDSLYNLMQLHPWLIQNQFSYILFMLILSIHYVLMLMILNHFSQFTGY